MKITIENNAKEYFIDRIQNVYIGFDDNVEVKLNQIVEYDIDLDNTDCSTIEFRNAFNSTEIENHFKGNSKNHIIYIRIELLAVNPIDMKNLKVFYDIPCNMVIKRLKSYGDYTEIGGMHIELEGVIK